MLRAEDAEDEPPDDPGHTLTPQSSISIDYLPVPTSLSDYVTTFYHFRCDEPHMRDIQPAAIGHLTLFPYGAGHLRFRDGRSEPSYEVNLLTPFGIAVPFEVDGPFHAIGAVLNPLGWAALTGLCAKEHGNHIYRACEHLEGDIEQLGAALCDDYRKKRKTGQECADALGEYIAGQLRKLPKRHTKLIETVNKWLASSLNPDIDELYASTDYSPRQVQRLSEKYFGLPPRSLARKYRALRAAAWLALPALSDEAEAELAEAFYDQSHMIREIQLFAGRTPARLAEKDTPFLDEMLDLRNFREIGQGD